MKARVIKTGEMIELCNMEFDEDGNEYYRDELELIGDYEPDYWEKLKYQYIGMILSATYSSTMFQNTSKEDLYKNAIFMARELVDKLKEKSQCEK